MRLRPGKMTLRFAAGFVFVGAIMAGLAEGSAQPAPGMAPRIALVVGESNYRAGKLPSAANDAGLIADTLQRAGFDVAGAADLDQDGLRKALREFVDKAAAAGPDAIAFVYISGRGLQYAGENYIAPVEAAIPRASNTPLEAVRLSDYLQPLAQLPLKARVVVLDAARINTFAQSGEPLAGGLALVEPAPGGLYAFNAAPGSVAPNENGPYGVYAQALAEALRQPGLPLDEAFAQTRLRVSDVTKGAVIPWDESKLAGAPALFARAPDAPPPVAAAKLSRLQARPIREYPVEDAFAATLERDTIQGYLDFLAVYPDSPYAPRVRAMLALRREALTWRRAYLANTPNAYWSYLRVYPHGPHAYDARVRLESMSAALAPPPQFDVVEFDVPPPPPDEVVYFRRPYVVFDDPDWGPPPPFSELPPPVMIVDAPPPPPPHAGLLPLPLVVAPLVGAAVASQMGLFHAPRVIQTQVPAAQDYYNGFNRRAQVSPGAAPVPGGAPAPGGGAAPGVGVPGAAPGVPGAPAPGAAGPRGPAPGVGIPGAARPAPQAAPVGAPLPHPGAPANVAPAAPGGSPLPHPAGQAVPNAVPQAAPAGAPAGGAGGAPANVPPTAPGGSPLPHRPGQVSPTVPNAAPQAAPVGAPMPHPAAPANVAPTAPAAPGGSPLPHPAGQASPTIPNAAQPPHSAAPAAAPAQGQPPAPHMAPPQAPHMAPPQAPHMAPPQAPHMAPPQAPQMAPPPAPHMAPPPAPHMAPPPAPHMAPPQAPHMAPPQAPHMAPPPAPHMAPPPAPHMAPPPAPRAAPPQAPPHPGHPNCGGPGQPPCH